MKCSICGETKYPIIKKKKCVRCVAKSNEDQYRKQKPKKILTFTSEKLVDEYILNGKSLRELSTEFGLSPAGLMYWLKYLEIPLRIKTETLKKRINSNFFSEINPDSAFLLGYIFTDGDLQYNNKANKYFLRLYSKYPDNLQKVISLLNSAAKLQHRKAYFNDKIRQGEIYFVHIADDKIVDDLIQLGMVRNKNCKVRFPNIPKDMEHHFIRGCWAGSGCVYFSKSGNITTRLVTGSYELITEIETKLNNAGLDKRKIYKHNHTKSPSYYFSYAHENSYKLFRYIFKGAHKKNTVNHQTEAFVNYFGERIF